MPASAQGRGLAADLEVDRRRVRLGLQSRHRRRRVRPRQPPSAGTVPHPLQRRVRSVDSGPRSPERGRLEGVLRPLRPSPCPAARSGDHQSPGQARQPDVPRSSHFGLRRAVAQGRPHRGRHALGSEPPGGDPLVRRRRGPGLLRTVAPGRRPLPQPASLPPAKGAAAGRGLGGDRRRRPRRQSARQRGVRARPPAWRDPQRQPGNRRQAPLRSHPAGGVHAAAAERRAELCAHHRGHRRAHARRGAAPVDPRERGERVLHRGPPRAAGAPGATSHGGAARRRPERRARRRGRGHAPRRHRSPRRILAP